MKYIEDELTDGQKSAKQLLGDLWSDTFGGKSPPKCTVSDLKEHYEEYKRHADQMYLMIRWLMCHGDKQVIVYHEDHPECKYYADTLRQIRYHEWSINDYVNAFLDLCEKAGQT